MDTTTNRAERVKYGLEAPRIVRHVLWFGGVALVIGVAGAVWARSWSSSLAVIVFLVMLYIAILGFCCLTTAAYTLWGSKPGKMRLRNRILARVPWRGDEQVLDVRCGHGFVTVGAAQHLRTGNVVGIDKWEPKNRINGTPEDARRNAQLEGVAERVEVRSSTLRQLPFGADTFDVVLSGWALHTVYKAGERLKLLEEMVRVLKPGGQMLLIDVRHTREYAEALRQFGLEQIAVSGPTFLSITPTRTVSARKPLRP